MEASKDDVILAQAELIARQEQRIGELTKRVDELIDSVNWYENATRYNETFEQLRDRLERTITERNDLRGIVETQKAMLYQLYLKEQDSVSERGSS